MYNKKTLTFTFHYHWGDFCHWSFVLRGGFCPGGLLSCSPIDDVSLTGFVFSKNDPCFTYFFIGLRISQKNILKYGENKECCLIYRITKAKSNKFRFTQQFLHVLYHKHQKC